MKQIFNGTVQRRVVAGGSKSEHTAIVLETDKGDLILRKRGENPFQESAALSPLVGKTVSLQGVPSNGVVFVGNILRQR